MRHFISAGPLGFGTAAVLALSLTSALAQQLPTTRVRGTIEKVENNTIVVRSREGTDVNLVFGDKIGVVGLKKIALAEIPANAFVGVAAQPRPDGRQDAISIHVFPESARGTNEGYRSYDVRPNSSMTNGAAAQRVKSTDGDVLTVTYKDGEKTFVITPETAVVRFEPGDVSELRPGAKIVATVQEKPDGTTDATRVLVGRDGITPAM
ncbi:MAG TPA: hypothetical protein VGC86_10595 [Afipia sp.]